MSPGGSADAAGWVPAALRVALSFEKRFGSAPSLIVRAPGRVNLLGEHTDYNQGFVLPMALDQDVAIALRPRLDCRVELESADFGDARGFDLTQLGRGQGWIEYVKGIAWALQEAGLKLRGFEGTLTGDVPIGAGLSSSAALELAVAAAFAAVSELPWDPLRAAQLSQRAESGWVGVQCGIMDQLVVATGEAGHALLIDCRDLTMYSLPVPTGSVVVVLDTSTRRGLIDSSYNDRRAGCEAAAAALGLGSLRELELADLERRSAELPESQRGLVRHVVTENARTLAGRDALREGDAAAFGRLMLGSHESLRDDFGVSSDALDAMVRVACAQPGCFGARMTGAGFAGCAVALVQETAVAPFSEAVQAGFRRHTGLPAAVHACRPSRGVSVQVLG